MQPSFSIENSLIYMIKNFLEFGLYKLMCQLMFLNLFIRIKKVLIFCSTI